MTYPLSRQNPIGDICRSAKGFCLQQILPKFQFRKHSFCRSKIPEISFFWRSRLQLENLLEMNSCKNLVPSFPSVISSTSILTFGKCGYFEFRPPVVFFIFLCWYLFIYIDSKFFKSIPITFLPWSTNYYLSCCISSISNSEWILESCSSLKFWIIWRKRNAFHISQMNCWLS